MNDKERLILVGALSAVLAPKLTALGIKPEDQPQVIAGAAILMPVAYHLAVPYVARVFNRFFPPIQQPAPPAKVNQ